MRKRLRTLIAKWWHEQALYPLNPEGHASAAAVRLCANELTAAITEQSDATAPASGDDLHLRWKATDHIWLMMDGDEPHVIGIRVDCGDSGVLYVTREQALALSKQLKEFEPRTRELQSAPESAETFKREENQERQP